MRFSKTYIDFFIASISLVLAYCILQFTFFSIETLKLRNLEKTKSRFYNSLILTDKSSSTDYQSGIASLSSKKWSTPTYQSSDIEKVLKNVESLESGYVFKKSDVYIEGKQSRVIEVSNSFKKAMNLELISGSWFSENETKNSQKVIVLSRGFAYQKFGNLNIIGNLLQTRTSKFKIVGIFDTTEKILISSDIIGIIPENTNSDQMSTQTTSLYFIAKELNYSKARIELGEFAEKNWNPNSLAVSLFSDEEKNLLDMQDFSIINVFTIITLFIFGITLYGIINLFMQRITKDSKLISLRRALGNSLNSVKIQIFQSNILLNIFSCLISFLIVYFLPTNKILDSYLQKESYLPYFIIFSIIIGIILSIPILNKIYSIKISSGLK